MAMQGPYRVIQNEALFSWVKSSQSCTLYIKAQKIIALIIHRPTPSFVRHFFFPLKGRSRLVQENQEFQVLLIERNLFQTVRCQATTQAFSCHLNTNLLSALCLLVKLTDIKITSPAWIWEHYQQGTLVVNYFSQNPRELKYESLSLKLVALKEEPIYISIFCNLTLLSKALIL